MSSFSQRKSCSIIGTTILLISKLPQLKKLEIKGFWLNDHHPKVLKLFSNTSVKKLSCTFEKFNGTVRSLLEFIAHFQAIECLSLHIDMEDINSFTIPKKSFLKRFPKLNASLKELHLDIDALVCQPLLHAFSEARLFTKNICKLSLTGKSPYEKKVVSMTDAYYHFLLCCSVQSFSYTFHPEENLCPSEYYALCNSINSPKSHANLIVSLYGCNNLKTLRFTLLGLQIPLLHQLIQTVSSRKILEIHIVYEMARRLLKSDSQWGEIDNLIVQNFPMLSTLSIEWKFVKRVSWADLVSESAQALPQIHQKGILRTVLPEPKFLL